MPAVVPCFERWSGRPLLAPGASCCAVRGGIGVPALQALATEAAPESEQGALQGVLASTVSLASILAPLGFSTLTLATRTTLPGAVWLSVIAVYALTVPLVMRLGRRG